MLQLLTGKSRCAKSWGSLLPTNSTLGINPVMEHWLQTLPAPSLKQIPLTQPFETNIINTLLHPGNQNSASKPFTFPRNTFSQLTEDLSPLLHAGCSYFHCKPLQCVRNLKPQSRKKIRLPLISSHRTQTRASRTCHLLPHDLLVPNVSIRHLICRGRVTVHHTLLPQG